jgi:hypothetical protein
MFVLSFINKPKNIVKTEWFYALAVTDYILN